MQILPRKHLRLSGGTQLAYVSAGDPSAPAVLLLHGFPSSANTFRDVIPVLAEAAHVIAPDLPGFGASEPLARPSFETFGEAILELLAHRASDRATCTCTITARRSDCMSRCGNPMPCSV